jgi:hypothetical protein
MDASEPQGVKQLKLRDVADAMRKMMVAIESSNKNFPRLQTFAGPGRKCR